MKLCKKRCNRVLNLQFSEYVSRRTDDYPDSTVSEQLENAARVFLSRRERLRLALRLIADAARR